MKKTAFIASILLCLCIGSNVLQAKEYLNPITGVSNTKILTIDKIVTSDSATFLHFSTYYHGIEWAQIAPDTYLQANNKKYTVISSEGIELGENFKIPKSGKTSFILKFPPLPRGTKSVDFIESDNNDYFQIYDIDLTGKKKYPAYPVGLPANLRKSPQDGPLPAPIFKRGTSQINITLLGYRDGLPKEMKLDLQSYFQNNQENTLKIDQTNGSASITLDLSSTGIITIYAGNFFFIHKIFIAPGETTDIYVDLNQVNQRGNNSRRQYIYCSGTYGDYNILLQNEAGKLPMRPFNFNSKDFMDYRVTADEYVNIIKTRYDASLDTLTKRSGISRMVKEFCVASMKQQLIFAIHMSSQILEMNYRINHNRQDRKKVDFVFAQLEKRHYDQLAQWVDMGNPNLLMDTHFKMWEGGLYQMKEMITDPMLLDFCTVRPIMEKAQMGRLTDEDKTALSNLHHSYLANICLDANEQGLKEVSILNQNPLVPATPDVTKEKLFETIIAKHKGKVILVDFWNTWCGPCRSAMKAVEPYKTAELKSDKIVWIYIANETSPTATYAKMIKEIAGEHYRLNQEQWEYVCNQNEVDGIPFYVVVNPDGSFTSRPDLRDHNKLKDTLLEMIK